MRGASALGQLLARYPRAHVRVLVIWLPVLNTDTGPPTAEARRPLRDPRVVELWDPKRWASNRMLERAAMEAKAQGRPPPFGPDDVAWDLIALFPAGARWEDPFPLPEWFDGPVWKVLDPVEKVLSR